MSGSESQYLDNLVPWDGGLYAANTDHHRRYDDDFLATLALRPTDRVLDVGCGSGDFTAKVAALVPAGHVVGLEPQPSMVAEAEQRALPNQSFVLAPAQELARAAGDSVDGFDVVMSRSVLHWVPVRDHRSILEQCRQVLRPGGLLRIECGGGDNTRDVVPFLDGLAASVAGERAVRAPWTFLHAGEYLDTLLDVGFDIEHGFVRTVAQRRPFDRESMLGWLHSQVIQAYEVGLDPNERARLRAAVDEHVDELRRPDETYDVTFVRLDLRANAPVRQLRR
jgi:trans-aconitate methyltransferase